MTVHVQLLGFKNDTKKRNVLLLLLLLQKNNMKKIRNCAIVSLFFFAVALRPDAGHSLLILEVSRSHTTTHHSR